MMHFRSLLIVATGCMLAGCATSPVAGPAAEDLGFLPQRYERGRLFLVYDSTGRALPARNWTSQFDFTGVSWNDVRTATAISRRHVVMAAHFIRDPSVPVVFHDRQGVPHIRRLTQVGKMPGVDIAVGVLDSPLPPEIAHYPLAMPGDATYKRAVLVTNQTRTVTVHRIGPVNGHHVQLGYDPKIDRRYWRNLVAGDSGNPAFIIKNGKLHLLTTLSTGGPGAGPFYGHPEIRAAIQSQTLQ
jgi:hypothetical protein